MTGTSDSLGRTWSHEKLDRILADPEVGRIVCEAERIGYDATGAFNTKPVEAWAKRQGRSPAGIALLFLLCWRAACWRRGRAA